MQTSFYRARELGYHGTADAWREILRCWPPPAETKQSG